jgi:hypothetical protein
LINQAGKKGPALLILLAVAGIFTALGTFLDGEVLPTSPDTEQIVKATAVQSSLSRRCMNSADITEPSNVLQKLSRTIEAANQNKSDSASRPEDRITASGRLIDETNQLLEAKVPLAKDPLRAQIAINSIKNSVN